MTPYLKGNVAGQCPRCEGKGGWWPGAPGEGWRRCPTCKGRGIVGKPAAQVVAETLGREWVSPRNGISKQLQCLNGS